MIDWPLFYIAAKKLRWSKRKGMGFVEAFFLLGRNFYSGGDEPQIMLFYLAIAFLFPFLSVGALPAAHSSENRVDWTGLALILFRLWVFPFTRVI